jgi:hypothetical protein
MTQASIVISNASGAAVRSAVNSALEAITTKQSGSTAPSTTYPFMEWADTANDLLKQRNAANSAWITKGTLSAAYGGLPASSITYDPGSPALLNASTVQEAIDELTSSGSASKGHIFGLTLSNDTTDATNDIGIAAGQATDSTNASLLELGSSLIKKLDANWAAGTNQGMRYSGAAIANTTYCIWLVATASGTTDVYATPVASATTPSAALALLQAETGGSSYVYIQYLGVIVRSSGAIVPFFQDNDNFELLAPQVTTSATVSSASATDVTLTGMPTGLKLYAKVGGTMLTGGGGGSAIIMYSPDQTSVPSPNVAGMNTVGQNQATMCSSFGPGHFRTDTSGRVKIQCSGNTPTLYTTLYGWRDQYRGRM